MKRLCKVSTTWSPELAYVLGVIATDGNLSPDGRHINITSKDEQLLLHCKICLRLDNRIGRKARGGSLEKKYYVLQFGDINFYEFLNRNGLYSAKSKSIDRVSVPRLYFKDFLRGCVDGDGSISVATHPESSKVQLRLRICSASMNFLKFLKEEIVQMSKINGGWIYTAPSKNVHILSFGKADSVKILKVLYYNGVKFYLRRKYSVARNFLNGRVA